MKPRLRVGPFQQKSVVLIVGIGAVKCVPALPDLNELGTGGRKLALESEVSVTLMVNAETLSRASSLPQRSEWRLQVS